MRSSDNHIRAISQEIPRPSTIKITLKFTYIKFHFDLPGANELKSFEIVICKVVVILFRPRSGHTVLVFRDKGDQHVCWWNYDDVMIMMTSSNGNIFRVTGPFVRGIHRSPVISPHKGQWRRALMFSLIYASINGWVNNREAGDLRSQRAHYDVTVMIWKSFTVAVPLWGASNARRWFPLPRGQWCRFFYIPLCLQD